MDFSSFLQKNSDDNGDENLKKQIAGGQSDENKESDIDFLKDIDEKELDPVPKPKRHKRSASSRLNDMLISAPPEDIINPEDAILPEETNPKEEKDIPVVPKLKADRRIDSLMEEDDEEDFDDEPTTFDKIKEVSLKVYEYIKKKIEESKKRSAESKKDNSIGVNLVKDEIIQFFDWQKALLIVMITVFVSFFIVIGAYWGITLWANKVTITKDQLFVQDYYRINKQIRELDPEIQRIKKFQVEFDKIDFLMKRHVYWTNFFDFLERNTLADVYFSGFSGGTGGSYNLSGHCKNFETLDAQKKKFLEDEMVTSASITSGNVTGPNEEGLGGGISFVVSFSINPDIFYK